MTNRYWLLKLPVLVPLLVSHANHSYGMSNRVGLFDILAQVPEYFQQTPMNPIQQQVPNEQNIPNQQNVPNEQNVLNDHKVPNPQNCGPINSPRAYEIIEQIMNLAMDALAEMNVESCVQQPSQPEIMDPEKKAKKQPSPFYPQWPLLPKEMSLYERPWPRDTPFKTFGRSGLGRSSKSYLGRGMSQLGLTRSRGGISKQSRPWESRQRLSMYGR